MHARFWVLAATLVLAPVTASAGDGTFGVPPSGILLPPPPARTASFIPPERAAPERQRAIPRVQQTYSPAPADGAGRSRIVPPSEAPIHSPIVVPPKRKQFRAPTASIDPDYVQSVAQGEPRSLSAAAPVAAPVVAQGAPAESKRGLFNMLRDRPAPARTVQTVPAQPAPIYTSSAASAAYHEQVAMPAQPVSVPAPSVAAPRTASRFSFGGARPSARARDGTPCGQLRGIFTSPAECR